MTKQFFLCTENYNLDEVKLLIEVLEIKFGLKAGLNKRVSSSGRIKISRLSMNKLK